MGFWTRLFGRPGARWPDTSADNAWLPTDHAPALDSAPTGPPSPSAGASFGAQVDAEVRRLRAALELVREYPDFDNGGPMANMIDDALAGRNNPALDFIDRWGPVSITVSAQQVESFTLKDGAMFRTFTEFDSDGRMIRQTLTRL